MKILPIFGGEINLAVWWSSFGTAKLKSANISCLHNTLYMYVWQSFTEWQNLHVHVSPPIFCQWQFGAQSPNLILANIFSYIVSMHMSLLNIIGMLTVPLILCLILCSYLEQLWPVELGSVKSSMVQESHFCTCLMRIEIWRYSPGLESITMLSRETVTVSQLAAESKLSNCWPVSSQVPLSMG